MKPNESNGKENKGNDVLRYAGLGTQIFVSLGIAVYLGYLADERLIKLSFPLATILFPLIVLFVMIYSLIKQTSKRRTDDIKK